VVIVGAAEASFVKSKLDSGDPKSCRSQPSEGDLLTHVRKLVDVAGRKLGFGEGVQGWTSAALQTVVGTEDRPSRRHEVRTGGVAIAKWARGHGR